MKPNHTLSLHPRRLAWSAAFCLSVGLSGCLINTSSRTENSGKFVSANTLAQLQAGKDKAYVLALIGEPTSRTMIDGGTEIWKWVYTENKNSSGHVIFILNSDNQVETQRTSYVEFQNDKVVKTWAD